MTIFRKRYAVGGFTLIEVLVSLFIVVVSVGALGMTLGHLHNTSQLEQHAERFGIWLERTRQHAVVRNMTYRINYDVEKNHFSLLEYREGKWHSANLDKVIMTNPEGTSIHHTDKKNESPLQILIYPDNSYSVFGYAFFMDSEMQVSVMGDGYNTIAIGKGDS